MKTIQCLGLGLPSTEVFFNQRIIIQSLEDSRSGLRRMSPFAPSFTAQPMLDQECTTSRALTEIDQHLEEEANKPTYIILTNGARWASPFSSMRCATIGISFQNYNNFWNILLSLEIWHKSETSFLKVNNFHLLHCSTIYHLFVKLSLVTQI